MKKLMYFIFALGITYGASAIGTIFTTPEIPTWYAGLAKSSLNPPSWIFGPVWTTLYFLIAVTLYRFLIRKHGEDRHALISAYLVQLILNTLWSIVFFGMHSLLGGLLVIAALWFSIVYLMVCTWKFDKVSAYLLVPYIAWVSFASYLNYAIWILN